MKKNISNINDRARESRHSGLELMKGRKAHILVEMIEYFPNTGVTKTIIKKTSGNTSISPLFEAGEEFVEKISPFDNFIQVVDGTVEVGINDKKYKLRLGEGIVIPAHTLHRFNASQQFKMISTVIKGGHEE